MRKYIVGLFSGILIMTSTLVFAESTQMIEAIFGRVRLVIDGSPVEQETLLYNGTTYVPLRAAAEALGRDVNFDAETQTAYIGSVGQVEQPSTQTTADDFVFSTQTTTTYNDMLNMTQTVGEVTNNSGKDYQFIYVGVTYYKDDGTVLGKGTAIIQDIRNGQSKSFESISDGKFDNAARTNFQIDLKM